MKYRILTFQELSVLEDDFSEFLYRRGFNQYDWNFLQDHAPIQAIDLIGQYSDITFEKVMQAVEYLAYRNEHEIISYRCNESELIKITVQSLHNNDLDFTRDNPFKYSKNGCLIGCKFFKEVSNYKLNREKTIFGLIEEGYIATDDKLHDSLKHLKRSYLN